MTFYEMLEQVVALLQRHGRLSYRALKVEFELDDDRLDLLKAELIDIQHVARDQDGRMLVWTGGTEIPSLASASASPPPVEQVITQQDVSRHVASPPTAPPTSEAERRQLTVVFCDLVESTKLSSQLDPEDYRDVVRAYQRVCAEVITRYEGHVAQLLGDGLLVYFGYPQAHEDDPQRAVRAGLGMLAAMEDLNTHLQREKGIQIGIRLGIHTGLVVVGQMGEQGRQEQLALGEVPNIASRIEGLAAPNTIAVSEATYHLIQGYFECQDLGAQTLRGVAEPVHVYRVLQASGATSRLDVAQPRGLTPLIGRESEVALLMERWEQAKAGYGQVMLLSGEAGIGKSRLVQMLKEHVTNESHTLWECRSLSYFENTSLFPLTDLFQRLLRFQSEETPNEKLGKLEQTLSQYRLPLEESVPLFAPLLSLSVPEHAYPPLNLSPQRQRQKTLETIIAILLELAEHQPVLFILEDLHWTDPTTLELLGLLVEQVPTTAIATLLTCRPHFQPSWHHRSYITEMTLNHLSYTQVEQIVTCVTDGKTLPQEVLAQIVEKTDGVPLFVEEMTKAILESGHLKEIDGHYELIASLISLAIPATLQDSLMARLDRLVTAKAVAQYASVIGRQFAYELLQVVSELDEMTLQRELGRLVEAELVYQRGVPPQATYLFKHALVVDAAYASLLKSTRQQYHQRIAQVLEERFPETVETQPELLAHHYTEAGLNEQAVSYWHKAGQRAIERSANVEAIGHLTRGLALLQTLPVTPARAQQELLLHITFGVPLIHIKGYAAPEVERTYTHARELCQQVGETPQLFSALWGLWLFYVCGGGHREMARELGEQLLSLAQSLHDRAPLAHYALGCSLFLLGEFSQSREHLEQGIALYNPQWHGSYAFLYSQDPRVVCSTYAAWLPWYLGYPDQALKRSNDMLTFARELSHPFSLAFALNFAAALHQFRGDRQAVQEQAEVAVALCAEQGFPFWLAMGTILQGWVLAEQGQAEQGIAQIRQGLAAYRATGAELYRPYFLALLAEACGKGGRTEEGLTVIAEALAQVNNTGERYYEPELYRLKGTLLLQQSSDNATEAESCFLQAMTVAQNQQGKSLELRAVTSLARLWQSQGKRQEAHDLLAPVYHWFTEGFDTLDLKDAKALLDALEEGS